MAERKAIMRELARRYRQANKGEKGRLLDQYVELTACMRNHASWLVRSWGQTVWDYRDGQLVKIVIGRRRRRRRTARIYDQQTKAALR